MGLIGHHEDRPGIGHDIAPLSNALKTIFNRNLQKPAYFRIGLDVSFDDNDRAVLDPFGRHGGFRCGNQITDDAALQNIQHRR